MTTSEKGFWHKTKEMGGNLWEGTKNVTEDVWEGTKNVTENVWDGTKNMAGNLKEMFSDSDKDDEDFYEEIRYSYDSPEEKAEPQNNPTTVKKHKLKH